MKQLRGRNAVVTGASRGMGVQIAAALAREGTNLALVARTPDDLESVTRQLASHGTQVIAIAADITQAQDLAKAVERAEAALGQIDILVNNAGVAHWIPFAEQSECDIARIIETNLTASILLTRLVLPGMVRRGCGHIVNVSSVSGKIAAPYEAVYSASKAGLVNFSRALRMELARAGVGVSVLCPVYYSTVGGFARTGVAPPRLAGSVSPEWMGRAVVQAIRRNRAEDTLWRGPSRPLLALLALSPLIENGFLRVTGVVRLNRMLAGLDGSSPTASWNNM